MRIWIEIHFSLKIRETSIHFFLGLKFFKVTAQDKIIDCLSNMDNNMVPYATAMREKNTYFLCDH